MTDLPPNNPREDDLLLDALDGDPEATAMVAAEPRLAAALHEMKRHRDSLRAVTTPIEPSVREASLAAAMSVYDDIHASKASAETVRSLAKRHRRTQNLLRSFGVVAASAAAVIGVLVIGPDFGGSDSDSIAADDALRATTTAAAEASAVAPADTAGRVSRADLEADAPTAAAAATSAPADALAASTTTSQAAAEANLARETADFRSPEIDTALLECAVSQDLDTSLWITSTLVDTEIDTESSRRFVVLLDTGLEIDVEFDPATCLFEEIGEPHIPRPPGG